MKLGIKVLPREEVLDTQGRAVEASLRKAGQDVRSCRVGKYILVEVGASSETEALAQVKAMAEYVLYNPLIERYEVEILK
jgi:phosphoribosylformylglycinamidine synthase PurS subunit